MEVVQDWVAYVLNDDAIVSRIPGRLLHGASTLRSWCNPFIDQLLHKPDLATIALLLVIVLISLKILDILYKTVIFWLRMMWNILFWVGLTTIALWMYTRGPEGVVEDLSRWYDVWHNEYQYWKAQEKLARPFYQKTGGRRNNILF